jgi:hypothetical protein
LKVNLLPGLDAVPVPKGFVSPKETGRGAVDFGVYWRKIETFGSDRPQNTKNLGQGFFFFRSYLTSALFEAALKITFSCVKILKFEDLA